MKQTVAVGRGPSKNPELDKLDADQLNTIDNFRSFLASKGVHLCQYRDGLHGTKELVPIKNYDDLRVMFFGTTSALLESERQALLAAL